MKYLKTLMGSAVAVLALAAGVGAQAGEIDLTTAGSSGSFGDGFYQQVPAQPTGTGILDSFVRIRKANQTVVEGYNTTQSNVFQNDGTNNYNHEITVGQAGFIDTTPGVDGGEVMRFLLDINQTGADPILFLDEVQIFISTTANQTTTSFLGSGLLNLADSALVYRMDDGADNDVMLDYSLNGGSGSGDMTLDIPLSAFLSAFGNLGLVGDDAQNGAFIYLYSKFSNNNDGYEEWAHFLGNPIGQPPCVPTPEIPCTPNFIPEPNTLLLFGLGLLGSAIAVRRGRRWS